MSRASALCPVRVFRHCFDCRSLFDTEWKELHTSEIYIRHAADIRAAAPREKKENARLGA